VFNSREVTLYTSGVQTVFRDTLGFRGKISRGLLSTNLINIILITGLSILFSSPLDSVFCNCVTFVTPWLDDLALVCHKLAQRESVTGSK